MSNIAIHAEGVGKQFQIGSHQRRSHTLRDALSGVVATPIRRMQSVFRGQGARDVTEPFWALRNVSFTVQRGEVIGIIGRNGAGKSTLLKILSRITEPTEGYIDVYGRVGSLLEVGTGFHAELTGRENIFLNGAILGMKQHEIKSKFDEIVAFGEVEKFIDTPVKHYSSGMYMRLAFAVAAHLEPDILIVDEVLAVGDSRFQEKCIGKMDDVARAGRTVLIVSHNMPIVQKLCSSAMLLEAGEIVCSGTVENVIAMYMGNTLKLIETTDLDHRDDRQGNQALHFTRVGLYDSAANPLERVMSGQDVRLRFYYTSTKPLDQAHVQVAFNIYNMQGILLTNLNAKDAGQAEMPVGREGYFECLWPRFNLRAGVYTCALFCEINGVIVDWIQSAFQIQVEDGDFFGSGRLISRGQGDMLVAHEWRGEILS
jgi:lipopolysaccharide transport system ATP-binding protein